MLWFILAIIFAIAAAVLILKGKFTDGDATLKTRGIGFGVLGVAILFLFFSALRVVDAGEVGVPVTFGSVGTPISSGVHLMAPWVGVTGMNTRTVEFTMTSNKEGGGDDSVEVKGSDGATGHVDSTTHYHVSQDVVGDLYKSVGIGYQDSVVKPAVRNCIHNAFGTDTMVDAATTKRLAIQGNIQSCIVNDLGQRGLVVEDFQVRNIGVEQEVQDAINKKVAAQQVADQKVFELQAARQDAEKSNIQNKAVSDGQQIIKCGGTVQAQGDGQPPLIVPNTGEACQNQLSPEYLQWAYIDMMKSIANSPNHDTIVIPAPTAQSQNNVQIQVPTK